MSHPFGRYNLVDFLASGGMADVYRAEAPGAAGFVKELALKVIRGDFGDQPELIEMFKQEARLASRLTHANIVQVFDFDEVDGRYCIAMEFVHGRTLAQLVNRCRTAMVELDLPRSLHVCAQVASALAFAHRLKENGQPLGIVHRDVSPQNVLVSFDGDVKLTDFGIARAMNAAGLTRPGIVKGKPAYMAPEQARGHEVDGRADIFALGVVLWELCCGFNLFARETESAALLAVVGPDPVIDPPSKWNPAVSPELDAVVLGALERDPQRRTGSAQELTSQLQSILFKLARDPAEFELRSLMTRLWPEGATAAGTPRTATVKLATPQGPMVGVRTATSKPFPETRPFPLPVEPAGPLPMHPSEPTAVLPQAAVLPEEPAPDVHATPPKPRATPPQPTAVLPQPVVTPERPAPQRAEASPRPIPPGSRRSTRFIVTTTLLSVIAVASIGSLLYYSPTAPPTTRANPPVPPVVADKPAPAPAPAPAAPSRVVAPASAPVPAQAAANTHGPTPAPAPAPPPSSVRAQIPPPQPAEARAQKPRVGSTKKPAQPSQTANGKAPGSKPSPTPEASAQAEATLQVFSTTWAVIYVDGKRIDVTPVTVKVPPGTHQLRAEHDGLVPVEHTVTLGPGESGRWSPQLRAPK